MQYIFYIYRNSTQSLAITLFAFVKTLIIWLTLSQLVLILDNEALLPEYSLKLQCNPMHSVFK